jgi:DNA polymerase
LIKGTERLAEPVPGYVGKKYRKGGLAVICEAPGYNESQRGRPLVSRAGDLFTELVYAAGLEREELFLTNTVRCRPPGNRIKDYPEAVFACGSWTAAELFEYDPSVVVLMGVTAIQSVFGGEAKVGKTRGTFRALPEKHPWGMRACICTYHPTAAGYQGGLDSDTGRLIVKDLKAAKRALGVL